MTDRYGLKSVVIERIHAVFARFESIDVVILYGSRAKGTYKIGSDIDLTVKTKGDLPRSFLADISGAIDDLDLPYTFDISLFHQLNNENLIDHINRVGVEFYKAKDCASASLSG